MEAYGGTSTRGSTARFRGGRVLVRDGNRIESRLIAPDRDLLIIPSVAVHLDRGVNGGFAPTGRSTQPAAFGRRAGRGLSRRGG
ncbi:MAG: hypothetical protein ACLT98_09815 [Eggerthellaceae bacterium]